MEGFLRKQLVSLGANCHLISGFFIAEILLASTTFRLDASDNMPFDVGRQAFWSAGTAFVAGDIDVDEFLAQVEAAWP